MAFMVSELFMIAFVSMPNSATEIDPNGSLNAHLGYILLPDSTVTQHKDAVYLNLVFRQYIGYLTTETHLLFFISF